MSLVVVLNFNNDIVPVNFDILLYIISTRDESSNGMIGYLL